MLYTLLSDMSGKRTHQDLASPGTQRDNSLSAQSIVADRCAKDLRDRMKVATASALVREWLGAEQTFARRSRC